VTAAVQAEVGGLLARGGAGGDGFYQVGGQQAALQGEGGEAFHRATPLGMGIRTRRPRRSGGQWGRARTGVPMPAAARTRRWASSSRRARASTSGRRGACRSGQAASASSRVSRRSWGETLASGGRFRSRSSGSDSSRVSTGLGGQAAEADDADLFGQEGVCPCGGFAVPVSFQQEPQPEQEEDGAAGDGGGSHHAATGGGGVGAEGQGGLQEVAGQGLHEGVVASQDGCGVRPVGEHLKADPPLPGLRLRGQVDARQFGERGQVAQAPDAVPFRVDGCAQALAGVEDEALHGLGVAEDGVGLLQFPGHLFGPDGVLGEAGAARLLPLGIRPGVPRPAAVFPVRPGRRRGWTSRSAGGPGRTSSGCGAASR